MQLFRYIKDSIAYTNLKQNQYLYESRPPLIIIKYETII